MTSIHVTLQLVESLIEIGAHHQHSFEPRAVIDAAPYSDHRILDGGAVDYAALRYDRALNPAIEKFRSRQVARTRVHRRFCVKEIERRQRESHLDVGAIKCSYGPDVLPVAVEQMRLHVVLLKRAGKELSSEINCISHIFDQQFA